MYFLMCMGSDRNPPEGTLTFLLTPSYTLWGELYAIEVCTKVKIHEQNLLIFRVCYSPCFLSLPLGSKLEQDQFHVLKQARLI